MSEYHYVITVSGAIPREPYNEATKSISGVCTPGPDATRRDVFTAAYEHASRAWHETHGDGPDPVVRFWSLEPNTLT
ncbi:MAG TPA: hypothetical protein VFX70_11330 [Mycobacteriales bacterium]|nr:hypothetical protein [Mycobacteriales bacterium]